MKKYLFIIGLLFSLNLFAQEDESQIKYESESEEVMQISEIPMHSEEVVIKVSTDFKDRVEEPVVSRNIAMIDTLANQIDEIKQFTDYAISRNFGYNFIESFLSKWDEFIAGADIPEQDLASYTEQLEKILIELSSEKQLWTRTMDRILEIEEEGLELPEETKTRTEVVVEFLDKSIAVVNDSLNNSLNLQNKIVDIKLTAQGHRDHLEALLKIRFTSLMGQKTYTLFNIPEDTTDFNRAMHRENNRFFLKYNLDESKKFLSNNWSLYTRLVFPFFLIWGLIIWMKSRVKELEELHVEQLEMGKRIFKRPLTAALFFTLLLTIGMGNLPPLPVRIGVNVLIILSFVLLAPRIIVRPLRWSVYFFGFLFVLIRFSELYIMEDLSYRLFHLSINLILISFVVWFVVNHRRISHATKYDALWFDLLKFVSPVYLVMLVCSLIANTIGYLYLSFLINTTILDSFLIGILFGVIYTSTSTLIILFLNTSLARKSVIIRSHYDLIVMRTRTLLRITYYWCWGYFTLTWFLLLELVNEILIDILQLGFEMRGKTFTLGNVLSFVAVLVASWAISNFIRLLLRDEVLSRMKLARGVPMAISSLTYYGLITGGFFVALFSVGFDLENLGLIAGALSVGIGFGLQNVVSNFISGLILIFERPVTIGDVVKLDDVEGEVVNIGIRSSRIRKYNGSVLIVPNAQLISNKVTNRTLDNPKRRFILTIHTPIDVDPETVILIMSQSAKDIPTVLSDPPAKAYFKGTHEQAKVFDLFYWVSDEILDTKSQVAINVHKDLKKLGIEVISQKKIEIITNSEKEN